MSDALAGLPRVTYANAAADFSALHAVLDRALPAFAARALDHDAANLAGGREDASGARYAVPSPIDARTTLGTLVAADAGAVDRAVAAARAAAPGWRATPWQARVAALRRVAAAIRRDRLDFAMAALLEVGKSRLEAMGEVEESIDLIEYYCHQVEAAEGFERTLAPGPGGERGHDRLRPYGAFAVIAPFNYPFALAIGMTTGALLGGNTVVLKPAAGAALSAPALARAFGEAGLPDGVFNLVCGGHETGAALAAHPGIDGIAFTGSHEVGMALMRAAVSGRFARPVLAELGGKNAAFVDASADLDAAASGVARSAFGLSGQKCSSCSKVYVHRAVREAFVERLLAFTAALSVGDVREARTFTGPVIAEAGAQRFEAMLLAAREAGATVLAGGARRREGLGTHGAYLAPTVVADAPPGPRDQSARALRAPAVAAVVRCARRRDRRREPLGARAVGGHLRARRAGAGAVRRPHRGGRALREPPERRHHRRLAGLPDLLRLEGLGGDRQGRSGALLRASVHAGAEPHDGGLIASARAHRPMATPRRPHRALRNPVRLGYHARFAAHAAALRTESRVQVVCLDLEGVLVPEIWIEFSRRTGIVELARTTRDEPDYDKLMRFRIDLLARHGLKLADIQAVIEGMGPMAGARDFLDALRARFQVLILSDTFYEFADPLMRQLGRPTLLCHRLETDAQGFVTRHVLRMPNPKKAAVEALKSLNFTVIAAGDSYNDTAMLGAADAGFFIHPPESIVAQFPQFPVTRSYEQLAARIDEASKRLP